MPGTVTVPPATQAPRRQPGGRPVLGGGGSPVLARPASVSGVLGPSASDPQSCRLGGGLVSVEADVHPTPRSLGHVWCYVNGQRDAVDVSEATSIRVRRVSCIAR